MSTLLFWLSLAAPAYAAAESGSILRFEETVGFTVGVSEKLGVLGVFSAELAWRDESTEYFVVAGTSLFIIGGVGVGWKHHFFPEEVVSPYTCVTAYGVYILPALCTHCSGIDMTAHVSGSAGVGIRIFEHAPHRLELQFGILSAFDLSAWEVFESPSDRPLLWPVANLHYTQAR